MPYILYRIRSYNIFSSFLIFPQYFSAFLNLFTKIQVAHTREICTAKPTQKWRGHTYYHKYLIIGLTFDFFICCRYLIKCRTKSLAKFGWTGVLQQNQSVTQRNNKSKENYTESSNIYKSKSYKLRLTMNDAKSCQFLEHLLEKNKVVIKNCIKVQF